jgi:hypothetical protein
MNMTKEYNKEMVDAAYHGHMNIVEEMIGLGATNFNQAMASAAYGGGAYKYCRRNDQTW